MPCKLRKKCPSMLVVNSLIAIFGSAASSPASRIAVKYVSRLLCVICSLLRTFLSGTDPRNLSRITILIRGAFFLYVFSKS